METRLAHPGDAEAILEIYNAEVLGGVATFDLVPRTLAEQHRWLDEHTGIHPCVVAVDDDGTVAGFASISPYRPRPAYLTTVEDSVYVRPDTRGQGVGKLVLSEVLALAGAHGFHTVIARINSDGQGSIALHHACGFALVGTEREIGRKFNRWLDVVVMQRML
ncbi:MAG: N-acetyltransferase family protein [Acidimicrobiaceae bacterium]|nr:N-acetyltransferase family protein [Acidimicrobiaceae bacterium]